jgi:23S rRNA (cytidine2498-2'-O)-methyltransferase
VIRRTLYTVPEIPTESRIEFLREAERRGVRFLAETGEYFLAEENAPDLAWASDIAWNAFEIEIPSIAQGAKNLKNAAFTAGVASPRWIRLEGMHHRRAALIEENLPTNEPPPLRFLRAERAPKLSQPLAGFFLIAPDRGVAVLDTLGPYPGGLLPFQEERVGPPSRAYLKMWEICARFEAAGISYPKPGDTTVDLGSCPGGWTWALAELGAAVFSIDGAPIDPAVEKRPEVSFERGDAFRLEPRKVDWVFSDMICEPKRLPGLIEAWKSVGCERFALSVKFKGEADGADLDRLRNLGGKLRHLRQNKHELTWFHAPGISRI